MVIVVRMSLGVCSDWMSGHTGHVVVCIVTQSTEHRIGWPIKGVLDIGQSSNENPVDKRESVLTRPTEQMIGRTT